MSNTSKTPIADAFRECGLYPQTQRVDNVVEARVRFKDDVYYGYSAEAGTEPALADLLQDLPEDLSLRLQGKAGLLA